MNKTTKIALIVTGIILVAAAAYYLYKKKKAAENAPAVAANVSNIAAAAVAQNAAPANPLNIPHLSVKYNAAAMGNNQQVQPNQVITAQAF
jgi:LPXTG-motif cell wall-anchored protein